MNEYKREPLRNGDAARLLAACESDFDKGAVGTLLETGLRLAELCSLIDASVNWEENRLRVVGKGNRSRTIPFSSEGAKYLRLWIDVPKPSSDHALRKAIQRSIAKAGVRAGIERRVHPHILRHCYAIRCLKRGISLRSIGLLLGHKSIATTQFYLNLSPEEVVSEFHAKW